MYTTLKRIFGHAGHKKAVRKQPGPDRQPLAVETLEPKNMLSTLLILDFDSGRSIWRHHVHISFVAAFASTAEFPIQFPRLQQR